MSAPRFFRLAYRLPAYKGALRFRLELEAREEAERPEAVTQAGVSGDPGMSDLIDFG